MLKVGLNSKAIAESKSYVKLEIKESNMKIVA